jgi:hypothetical protein
MFVIRVGYGYMCIIASRNFDSVLVYNDATIEAPIEFQISIFFSSPLDVNVCSSSHASNDGLSTPTPLTKFLNMPLGEQLLQVFNLVYKGKHPSHILRGFPRVMSYSTIPLIQFYSLISFKFFLPNFFRRGGNSIGCFKMFGLLSFHGLK